ncbi:LysR family transcriptional regulator [Inquilinus sp. NPDC058860]|uniref:LysR family transcriptional regulator n=1 Tax=Inquilinus sp. NPDC058860 TaxID=3346652 RepID=UPI0036BAC996
MLTLRQIEIIRAIMVTGTVAGAARLLNVSAPGVSRMMKYTEDSLGFNLFVRKGGRFVPTAEASDVFAQINAVYKKVEDLHYAIDRLEKGDTAELKVGSVPSIANVMVPRAAAAVRRRYPHLLMDIDILKIEDAIDYLLLGKGELVAMSYLLQHPALTFAPLARGELVFIAAADHPLASRSRISAEEIVRHPLIGIDPKDPYGRIMADIFTRHGLDYRITIRARFGTTVCALVRQNLGVAVIDIFTVADGSLAGLKVIPIAEKTDFQTYAAYRRDVTLSSFAEAFLASLRAEMEAVRAPRPATVTSG